MEQNKSDYQKIKESIVLDVAVIPDGWSLDAVINCYEETGFIIIDSHHYNGEHPPVHINNKNKVIDMNKDEFYRELMLRLADNEERENIEACVKQAKEFFGDNITDEDLEDITENPDNPASLEDAITKLGFELHNDRGLYGSYKNNLARIVFNALVNSEEMTIQEDIEARTRLLNAIEQGAEDFLDEFIAKTQNGYTVDNRNMTKE